tara:strand:- start:1074 stop:1256 length:183 start_codon:yes stop_codon:yes gene_type:complete
MPHANFKDPLADLRPRVCEVETFEPSVVYLPVAVANEKSPETKPTRDDDTVITAVTPVKA